MSKNTSQIALITHRRGLKSELPKQLNEGEFALTTDTNEIFMGNPNNPVLQERLKSNNPVFPYGNIQVLTEFSDNMNKIEYSYKDNLNSIKLPIIVSGQNSNPNIPNNTVLIINGEEIEFTSSNNNLTLEEVINIINERNLTTKSRNNNGRLELICYDNSLTLENGLLEEEQIGALEIFGFEEFNYTANSYNSRTLQEVLDDRLSIKNFDVYGDNETNDAESIYNTIISLYGANNSISKAKELFIPSGEYIINDKSILLLTNTYLKGEGKGRTILKSTNNNSTLFVTGDNNYISALDNNYCYNLEGKWNRDYPHNITIEDMTIDISQSNISTLLTLGSSYRVTFRNVEFIGSEYSTIIKILSNANISDLQIINCNFNNDKQFIQFGIELDGNVNGFIFRENKFSSITNDAIIFKHSEDIIAQTNGVIENNNFIQCGSVSGSVLNFGNKTSYINVINNLFEKDVIEQTFNVVPYINSNQYNYIDIRNINEDNRKFLQFNFNQPSWNYVDNLINPNGEYLIQSIYNKDTLGNIRDLTNGLQISQGDDSNNDTLLINSTSKEGDLSIGCGKYGDLNLGISSSNYDEWIENVEYNFGDKIEYVIDNVLSVYICIENHISNLDNSPSGNNSLWTLYLNDDSQINIGKNIDLNGHTIHNKNTNNDIEFETELNIIKIKDTNETVPYEYRISNNDDAVPNVKYVNSIANPIVRKRIDFNYLDTLADSKIPVVNFDGDLYGDFVYLRRVSINVRRPFYSMYNLIDETSAIMWKSNYIWYVGDVIQYKDENDYLGFYVCNKEHISTNDFQNDLATLNLWTEVYKSGTDYETKELKTLNDVKYCSIYASNGIDANRLLFLKNEIDLSKSTNSNNYPEIVFGQSYTKNDIVSYNNHNYQCITETNTPIDVYELHNYNNWKMINETGKNYIFDFDRTIYKINDNTGVIEEMIIDENGDFIMEYNFSGYNLELQLYDENGDLIPVVDTLYYEPLVKDWVSNTQYYKGEVIQYNGIKYSVIKDYISGEEFSMIVENETVLEEYVYDVVKRIQVNPSGAILLTLEYLRGND